MRRRLWKCVSDFVLEVLKIAEKTLDYTSCRSSSMRLMIAGERRNHTLSGEREAEFGMRNQGRRNNTAYPSRAGKRRFEYGGRSYRSAIYAAQLPRPLRFMAGAANEALRIRPDGVRMVTSRARLRYIVVRPAARNQTSIAQKSLLPALNFGISLSAGSAPTLTLSRPACVAVNPPRAKPA